jgi:hypothetical protein
MNILNIITLIAWVITGAFALTKSIAFKVPIGKIEYGLVWGVLIMFLVLNCLKG